MLFEWTFQAGRPASWHKLSPNQNLAPHFCTEEDRLLISGNGQKEIFGCYENRFPIKGGNFYRIKTRFRMQGVKNPNLSILNLAVWEIPGASPDFWPVDCITSYRREGDAFCGEEIFLAKPEAAFCRLRLGVRYMDQGEIEWLGASVEAVSPEEISSVRQKAKISVTRFSPFDCGSMEALLSRLSSFADDAGAAGSDLLLLPEFSNCYEPAADHSIHAEPIEESAVCRLLSQKAREHRMYICAAILEKRGDYNYNTAVLFGRDGKLVGTYSKTHLYWPECWLHGTIPGDEYPVFDLDFGRVGIIICYDFWLAEPMRLFALKGADLVLFPNAGYETKLAPARAIDNCCHLAISSTYFPGAVYNTWGEILAQTEDGTTVVSIEPKNRRCKHPNAGGNMNSGPGPNRFALNSVSDRVYEEILREIRHFEERPFHSEWL